MEKRQEIGLKFLQLQNLFIKSLCFSSLCIQLQREISIWVPTIYTLWQNGSFTFNNRCHLVFTDIRGRGERTDGTSDGLGGAGDQLREKFRLGPVVRLGGAVASDPARRAGDPSSNPGPGDNFSLKLPGRVWEWIPSSSRRIAWPFGT